MTYIIRLNSFDEVAAWYEKTPVLKSTRHPKEQDIRPIGERRRKWERIIKVNPNTYALSCGGHYDPVFNWGYSDKLKDYPLQPQDIARLAPIVWRKHKDGTETVTVRNGQGEWQHNATYSFLSRALPLELFFRINRQGRQAIYNRSEGKEYYLPKTKTVPRHVYEVYKERAAKQNYYKRWLDTCQPRFDNLSLTFKRTPEGKFELVGEAPKEMVKRTRVLKDEKSKIKSAINELYDWVVVMYPLMRSQLLWDFRDSVATRLEEIAKEHEINGFRPSWNTPFKYCEPELVRAIVTQPDHPMRYEFGIAAMFEINDAVAAVQQDRNYKYNNMSDEDFEKLQRSRMRAAYTRWINKVAGFAKTVKEEK
jgi:hypothetical protein